MIDSLPGDCQFDLIFLRGVVFTSRIRNNSCYGVTLFKTWLLKLSRNTEADTAKTPTWRFQLFITLHESLSVDPILRMESHWHNYWVEIHSVQNCQRNTNDYYWAVILAFSSPSSSLQLSFQKFSTVPWHKFYDNVKLRTENWCH